ncbi:MAG: PDGLE domain-containing protein [Endomicrobium sp.]|jgi:cobalt/nickel transport protein|nr:PDGLE domain-containing protein [Endomicrobium sp.]
MNKKTIAILVPIFVVLIASLFASNYPDILEILTINYNFDNKAKITPLLFTNYSFPFINNQHLSTFCSGITGLFILDFLHKVMNKTIKFFTN